MDRVEAIEEKVFKYITDNNMLKERDQVVVGVSGGADSVCLLLLLCKFKEKVPISLNVCHVNHGIREEAYLDGEYVEGLCSKLKIPFKLVCKNVPKIAMDKKLSEEEAGRNIRYEAFYQMARELGKNGSNVKIAIAHNLNDRSETLLFNLFRGSSIKGLGSIRPVRDNIIRPILCLERSEIEFYLKCMEINFCTDKTNLQNDYSRNKIRNVILPYVEENIIKGATKNMWRMAQTASEVEDYLEEQTAKAFDRCIKDGELIVPSFNKEEPLIQKRILYKLLTLTAGRAKDITETHILSLQKLLMTEGTRSINLPYGIKAIKKYDILLLIKNENKGFLEDKKDKEDTRLLLEVNLNDLTQKPDKEMEVIFSKGRFVFKVLDYYGDEGQIPTNKYTKWFDYDRIKQSLVIRNRLPGDYITIASKTGNSFHKTIKELMIDSKIPKSERDSIILITEKNHCLWLVGERISEYYKINESTKRVLQISLLS